MRNLGDDPKFINRLKEMTDISMSLTQTALEAGDYIPEKVSMALAAMSGPIAAIAMMTNKSIEQDSGEDNYLFAALLAGIAFAPFEKGACTLSVSPAMWAKAVDAFKMLRPDAKLANLFNAAMLRCVDDVNNDSVIPLETFLKARAIKKH